MHGSKNEPVGDALQLTTLQSANDDDWAKIEFSHSSPLFDG